MQGLEYQNGGGSAIFCMPSFLHTLKPKFKLKQQFRESFTAYLCLFVCSFVTLYLPTLSSALSAAILSLLSAYSVSSPVSKAPDDTESSSDLCKLEPSVNVSQTAHLSG